MHSPRVASEALPWALMKLLFDENLSPKLLARCADTFPGCAHVSLVGLEGHPDREIWDYARENEFTIVLNASDAHHRGVLIGRNHNWAAIDSGIARATGPRIYCRETNTKLMSILRIN